MKWLRHTINTVVWVLLTFYVSFTIAVNIPAVQKYLGREVASAQPEADTVKTPETVAPKAAEAPAELKAPELPETPAKPEAAKRTAKSRKASRKSRKSKK